MDLKKVEVVSDLLKIDPKNILEVKLEEAIDLKGLHFATSIEYLEILWSNREKPSLHLFIKKIASNSIHLQVAKKMLIMEKEATFYNEYLPKLIKFSKERNANELVHFLETIFPKCYFANSDVIILENAIRGNGYGKMAFEPLNQVEWIKSILTGLSRFQSTSFAFIKSTGVEEFRKNWELNLTEYFDPIRNPFFDSILTNGISNAVIILRAYFKNNEHKELIDFLQEYGVTNSERMVNLLKIPSGTKHGLFTLGHGDFQTNNLLKKDEGSSGIPSFKFVDLQGTRLCSPALDPCFFIYTSVQPHVRKAHLLQFQETYWNEFVRNSMELGCECPYTFQDFQMDFKKFVGFAITIKFIIITAAPAFKGSDFEVSGENESDGMKNFNEVILNWISKQNSETIEKLANEILSLTQELKQNSVN